MTENFDDDPVPTAAGSGTVPRRPRGGVFITPELDVDNVEPPEPSSSSAPVAAAAKKKGRRFAFPFGRREAKGLPDATHTTAMPPSSQFGSSADEYAAYLHRSALEDFSEEEKMGFIYQAGTDTAGRPIIVVVPAYLPAKSINLDRLLLFLIRTMDSVVSQDYALVYIHSNFSSQNRPPLPFLRKAYRILSRKYKKNLKALYIVHATFWIKTTFKMFRPFVSAKFWQKLKYINELSEIHKYIHRDQIRLPAIAQEVAANARIGKQEPLFGAHLEDVMDRPDHANLEVPLVVEKAVNYLRTHNVHKIQGIFRLSGSSVQIQQLQKDFDRAGDEVSLSGVGDPHVVAGLLKQYLRELPEPVVPFDFYDRLIEAHGAATSKEQLVQQMLAIVAEFPPANKAVLKVLLELIELIERHASDNKMNAANLAIIFAPNLMRSPKETLQMAVTHAAVINTLMRYIIEESPRFLAVLRADALPPPAPPPALPPKPHAVAPPLPHKPDVLTAQLISF